MGRKQLKSSNCWWDIPAHFSSFAFTKLIRGTLILDNCQHHRGKGREDSQISFSQQVQTIVILASLTLEWMLTNYDSWAPKISQGCLTAPSSFPVSPSTPHSNTKIQPWILAEEQITAKGNLTSISHTQGFS